MILSIILLLLSQMGFNRQLIPKLKSLSEKKVVSRRSQDLDVTLQTPDPGQSSGVSANGNEDSARPSPDDIQGDCILIIGL